MAVDFEPEVEIPRTTHFVGEANVATNPWNPYKSKYNDGGFAIDPAELLRAFPLQRPEQRSEGRDAVPSTAPEHPSGTGSPTAADELVLRLAVAEAELRGLKETVAELKQAHKAWREHVGAPMVLAESKTGRRRLLWPTWLPWRHQAG